MTAREEAEARCKTFADERGWEFACTDHYRLIAGEQEDDEPVYEDESDGFQLQFYNRSNNTQSALVVEPKHEATIGQVLDVWLRILKG